MVYKFELMALMGDTLIQLLAGARACGVAARADRGRVAGTWRSWSWAVAGFNDWRKPLVLDVDGRLVVVEEDWMGRVIDELLLLVGVDDVRCLEMLNDSRL